MYRLTPTPAAWALWEWQLTTRNITLRAERPGRSSGVISIWHLSLSWPFYTWSVRRVSNGLIQTQDHCSIHLLCQALLCCAGFCLPHSSYTKGTHVANMISSGFYLLCMDFCIPSPPATPSQIAGTLKARNTSLTSVHPALTSMHFNAKMENYLMDHIISKYKSPASILRKASSASSSMVTSTCSAQ